jgi:hypothetical protein
MSSHDFHKRKARVSKSVKRRSNGSRDGMTHSEDEGRGHKPKNSESM